MCETDTCIESGVAGQAKAYAADAEKNYEILRRARP
jgi:hypothetical protein